MFLRNRDEALKRGSIRRAVKRTSRRRHVLVMGLPPGGRAERGTTNRGGAGAATRRSRSLAAILAEGEPTKIQGNLTIPDEPTSEILDELKTRRDISRPPLVPIHPVSKVGTWIQHSGNTGERKLMELAMLPPPPPTMRLDKVNKSRVQPTSWAQSATKSQTSSGPRVTAIETPAKRSCDHHPKKPATQRRPHRKT